MAGRDDEIELLENVRAACEHASASHGGILQSLARLRESASEFSGKKADDFADEIEELENSLKAVSQILACANDLAATKIEELGG